MRNCPLCNNKNNEFFTRDSRNKEYFLCERCDMLISNSIFDYSIDGHSANEVKSSFDLVTNFQFEQTLLNLCNKIWLSVITYRTEGKEKRRILDVGSGWGSFLDFAKHQNL